jgi:hypothetical protein
MGEVMRKYKLIASKKIEKSSTKKVLDQNKYESYSCKFFANNFSEALEVAERLAKKVMVFETLKVVKL